MIYTLSYPVSLSGISGEYTIHLSGDTGTTLYAGSNDYASNLDIAPIVRQLVSPRDIRTYIDNGTSYSAETYNYIIMASGYTNGISFIWDYSSMSLYSTVPTDIHKNISGIRYSGQKWSTGTCPLVDRNDDTHTLYFLNLKGGISCIQMEGRNDRTISATRTEIKHQGGYYSAKPMTSTMLVSKNNSYELNTGWLNDSQSALFEDIMTSSQIYLQDYSNSTLIPVVITDSDMSVQTVDRDSLFNYTIKVQQANTLYIYG